MRPEGLIGRLFGLIMQQINRPSYVHAISLLGEKCNGRILEIGFGTGKLIELLLRSSKTSFVAGVDPAETMVSVARNRRAVQKAHGRCDLRVGFADHLAWGDASFDAVLAVHSFQFWPTPSETLREISRILRRDGVFIIVFRDHSHNALNWLPNPISRSNNEVEETASLLESMGFRTKYFPHTRGVSQALVAQRL